MLCIMSIVISMFLDNVTTVLLITPITIRLFESLDLNPVPVIPFIVLNVNVAGLTTLIGHPPNLLITNNDYISKLDITFLTFTVHMSIGVVLVLIQTNFHLRLQHKNINKILMKKSNQGDDLNIWRKCKSSIEQNPLTDNLISILDEKIQSLEAARNFEDFPSKLRHLKKMVGSSDIFFSGFQESLLKSQHDYSTFLLFAVPDKGQDPVEKGRNNFAFCNLVVFCRISAGNPANVNWMVCIFWGFIVAADIRVRLNIVTFNHHYLVYTK